MPRSTREFSDFASDVSQGSDRVKKSLDAVSKAAASADEAHVRLGQAQDKALKISERYNKAMDRTSKGQANIGSTATAAAKGVGTLTAKSSRAVGVMGKLAGANRSLTDSYLSAGKAADLLADRVNALDTGKASAAIEALSQRLSKLSSDAPKVVVGVEVDMSALETLKGQLTALASQASSMSVELGLDDLNEAAKKLEDFAKQLDDIEAKAIKVDADTTAAVDELVALEEMVVEMKGTVLIGVDASAARDTLDNLADELGEMAATTAPLKVYAHVRDYDLSELESETQEFFDNMDTMAVMPNLAVDSDDLMQKIRDAKQEVLSLEQLLDLDNADVGVILQADDAMAEAQRLADEYGRDLQRVLDGLADEVELPLPIVIRDVEGMEYLLAGNTRLMAAAAEGINIPVRVIDYDQAFEQMEELSEMAESVPPAMVEVTPNVEMDRLAAQLKDVAEMAGGLIITGIDDTGTMKVKPEMDADTVKRELEALKSDISSLATEIESDELRDFAQQVEKVMDTLREGAGIGLGEDGLSDLRILSDELARISAETVTLAVDMPSDAGVSLDVECEDECLKYVADKLEAVMGGAHTVTVDADVSAAGAAVGAVVSTLESMDPDAATEALNRLAEKLGEVAQEAPPFEMLDNFKEQAAGVEMELERLKDVTGDVAKAQRFELMVDLSQMNMAIEQLEKFDRTQQAAADMAFSAEAIDLRRAMQGLADPTSDAVEEYNKLTDVFNGAAGGSSRLQAALMKNASAAKEAAEQSEKLRDRVDKVKNVGDLLKKEMQGGADEMENFAGGLGVGNGALMAMGVGAIFAAKKLADLMGQFQGMALEVAKFNVQMAAAADAIPITQMTRIRNELALTRGETETFVDSLEDALNTGQVTEQQFIDTAVALRNTFGGSQIERLKEYVSILESIPSVEADLDVSADIDDNTAALFGLAQSGKISTVIDLQAAGLIGGVEAEITSAEDVELINAAQQTEKTVEGVYDALVGKMFPTWGPQFTAMVDNGFKLVGFAGGILAGIGALGVLATGQIVAQNATTAAVAGTGAVSAATGPLGGATTFGAVLGKGSVALKGFIASLGAVAAVTAGVAVAFFAASAAAGYFEKKFEAAGNELGAASMDLTSDLAMAGGMIAGGAALGAAIGSVVPVLGTALGAVIGGIIGLGGAVWTLHDDIGGTEGSFARLDRATQEHQMRLKEAGGKTVAMGVLAYTAGTLLLGPFAGAALAAHTVTKAMYDLPPAVEAEIQGIRNAQIGIETALDEAAEASENLTKAQQESVRKRTLAGLALQRQMQATKAAFESTKLALADFRREIAEIDLSNLAEIGGTTAQFDAAIAESGAAIKGRFLDVTDALAVRRAEILKDAKLNGPLRRIALEDLHKRELQAAKDFADGMNELIARIMKTPAILEAGFQRELVGADLDFQLDAGSIGMDEFFKQAREFSRASLDEYKATTAAAAKAREEVKKAGDAFEEAAKTSREAFKEEMGKLPSDIKGIMAEVGIDADVDFKDQMGKVNEAVKKLKERFDELGDDIDDIDVPSDSFLGLKNTVAEMRATQGRIATDVEEAQKELAKALSKGSHEEVTKARERLAELQKQNVEAVDAENKAVQNLNDLLKKSGVEGGKVNIARQVILNEELRTFDALAKNLRAAGTTEAAIEAVKKKEEETLKQLQEREAIAKKQDAVAKTLGTLEAPVKAQQNQIQQLENQRKLQEDQLTAAKNLQDSIERTAQFMDTGPIRDTRRLVEIFQAQTELSRETGEAVGRLADEARAQLTLYQNIAEGVQRAESEIENYSTELKTLQTTMRESADELPEEEAKEMRKRAAELEAALKVAKEKLKDGKQQLADARQELGAIGDIIDNMASELEEDIGMRRLEAELDMSDAIAELAQFNDEAAAAMGQLTQNTVRAAGERARMQRAALQESVEIAREELKERMAVARSLGADDNAMRTMKAEGERLILAKQVTKEAKIEEQRKRAVVDAARREAEFANEGLDLRQGVIDAEVDFLNETGGHFSRVLDLQREGIAIERERLANMQQQLAEMEAAGVKGRELEKQKAAVAVQSLKLRQKEVGVQKDIFEKILGKAFGQIRSSVGGRRGQGSMQALLGVERTRVMGRAGIFMKGDAKTIAERAADRTVGGKGGGMFGGFGGAPKRLPVEQEIKQGLDDVRKEAQDNKKNTKTTADSTSDMNRRSKGRSLHTHDFHVESKLDAILNRLGEGVAVQEAMADEQKKTTAAAQEGAVATEKVSFTTANLQKMSAADLKALGDRQETAIAKNEATLADRMEKLQKLKDEGGDDETVKTLEAGLADQKSILEKQREALDKVRATQYEKESPGEQMMVDEQKKSTDAIKAVDATYQDTLADRPGESAIAEQKKNTDAVQKAGKAAERQGRDMQRRRERTARATGSRISAGFGGAGQGFRGGKQVGFTVGQNMPTRFGEGVGFTTGGGATPMTGRKLGMGEGLKQFGMKPSMFTGEGALEAVAALTPKDKRMRLDLGAEHAKATGRSRFSGDPSPVLVKMAEDAKRSREEEQAIKDNLITVKDGIITIAQRSAESGSLYVHDVHVEQRLVELQSMLAPGVNTENVPVVADQTIEASQKDVAKVGMDRLETEAAGMDNAPGFAGVAGAAGAGGGATEGGPALRFVGELTVHFDSKMFRSEVVNIVGEAINTAEVRKSLERAGVLFS
jgi:hypothetical protein